MRILVACEESQTVMKAFRAKGHDAWSCDIQDCSGGDPLHHIKADVLTVLNNGWDMIIAHPPCTYLSVTGNRWFNEKLYGEKAIQRRRNRQDAIDFFMMFVNVECERIAIENPIGVMSSLYRKPDQIINPYQFGDPYEKRTCLWLKGLPLLKSTNLVIPEPRKKYKSGRSMPAWYAESWNYKKDERSKIRSKTFPGIAMAMADQWG